MLKLKRAALYIRVSTDEQARHGLSLGEQRADLNLFLHCVSHFYPFRHNKSLLLILIPQSFPTEDIAASRRIIVVRRVARAFIRAKELQVPSLYVVLWAVAIALVPRVDTVDTVGGLAVRHDVLTVDGQPQTIRNRYDGLCHGFDLCICRRLIAKVTCRRPGAAAQRDAYRATIAPPRMRQRIAQV